MAGLLLVIVNLNTHKMIKNRQNLPEWRLMRLVNTCRYSAQTRLTATMATIALSLPYLKGIFKKSRKLINSCRPSSGSKERAEWSLEKNDTNTQNPTTINNLLNSYFVNTFSIVSQSIPKPQNIIASDNIHVLNFLLAENSFLYIQ